MSARLRSADRAVRPGDRHRDHKPKDVVQKKSKSVRDSAWVDEASQEDAAVEEHAPDDDDEVADEHAPDDEVAEDAEEDEAAEAALPSDAGPEELSLPQLAQEIRQAHDICETHQRQATTFALKAGRLLIAAHQRVPHGEWLKWLKRKARISRRTAQRYVRLVKCETKLDRMNPSWRSEWGPIEALELLAEPTGQEDTSEEPAEEAADGALGEWADDETHAEDPANEPVSATTDRTAADQRREARSLFRRCVAYLPEFFKATTHWKFRARSPEQTALEQVEQALVRAARNAARPLHWPMVTRSLTPEMAAEVVAMALVQKLLEKGQVKKLFRPSP